MAWSSARSTRIGGSLRRAGASAGGSAATAGAGRARTVKRKVEPMPGTLRTPTVAAHEPDELPADGEPEPGAAGPPAQRVVRLHEILEDLLELRLGDADAGILDLDREHRPPRPRAGSPRAPCTSPRSVNLVALLRRLVSTCRSRIGSAKTRSRHARRPPRRRRPRPFCFGGRRHQLHHLVDQPADVDVLLADADLLRLELGEVEDVVQDLQAGSAPRRARSSPAPAAARAGDRRASARGGRAPRSSACGSRGSWRRGSATSPSSPPRPRAGAGSAPPAAPRRASCPRRARPAGALPSLP